MALSTDRLYLIKVKCYTVAITMGKDPLKAINNYIVKIGFANPYVYFCSRLMANCTAIIRNAHPKQYYGEIDTTTISGDFISVSSQLVVCWNDIVSQINFEDINNPLFVRPTIEEVRNCMGFSEEPMCMLRKFCI